MVKGFLLGLAAGAAAMWLLGDPVSSGIEARMLALRAGAAHRLRVAADAIEQLRFPRTH